MGTARHSIGFNSGRRAPGAHDRRTSCRYDVLFGDALLGWWEDSSFTHVPARLINLSQQGGMLELKSMPARSARQPIWFRSMSDSSAEWIESVVLSVRKPLFKRCRIRIAFHDTFPYQLFKKLVYGTEDFRVPTKEAPRPGEQDHYWK